MHSLQVHPLKTAQTRTCYSTDCTKMISYKLSLFQLVLLPYQLHTTAIKLVLMDMWNGTLVICNAEQRALLLPYNINLRITRHWSKMFSWSTCIYLPGDQGSHESSWEIKGSHESGSSNLAGLMKTNDPQLEFAFIKKHVQA